MLMTTITIDVLQACEREQAKELLVESYQQYETNYTNKAYFANYLQEIKQSLYQDKVACVFIAKCQGELLGIVQLYHSSQDAYDWHGITIQAPIIRLLAVHPKARGNGIAKQLIKHSMTYSSALGAKAVYLHTTDMMADAIRLYEKIGFVRDANYELNKEDFLIKCYRYDL